MALFLTAYTNFIVPAEGGYANDPADAGKETYAGISRVSFPNWSGWAFIDKQPKPIKPNTKFAELKQPVTDFYNALWTANNFDKIKNQDVANILFDWFVNSGSNAARTKGLETFGVDEILNRDFGFNLPMDGRFDTQTINAINSVDNIKLHAIIKAERKKFYETIIKRNPSQAKFKDGWFARINMFPDLSTVAKVSAVFVIFALVIVFVVISSK